MERDRETYISAVKDRPQAPPRLPCPHGDEIRPHYPGSSPGQGPQASVRLRTMSTPLPAVKRLKTRREFLQAAKGKKAVRSGVVIQARSRDGSLLLGADENAPGHIRAGFTATRKIGGAVIRNRAKRRLREIARLLLPLHGQPGIDYVFIARATTPKRDWSRLVGDVESALASLATGRTSGDREHKAQEA